jgi:hypothetical protein
LYLICAPRFLPCAFSRSEHCSSCSCLPVLQDLFPLYFSAAVGSSFHRPLFPGADFCLPQASAVLSPLTAQAFRFPTDFSSAATSHFPELIFQCRISTLIWFSRCRAPVRFGRSCSLARDADQNPVHGAIHFFSGSHLGLCGTRFLCAASCFPLRDTLVCASWTLPHFLYASVLSCHNDF